MTAVPALVSTPFGGAHPSLPLLVLGPSLGTSAIALWADCAQLLAANYQVVAWDLPGHGRSGPAECAFSIAELAVGVLAAVERTLVERGEPNGVFQYAGVSIGGAVGLQLLLDRPDLIAAASLVCTGARIGTAEMWTDRAEMVRRHGTEAVVDGSAARWFAPGFRARQPDVAARLMQSLRDADPDSYAWSCEALASFDVRDRLGQIATPVLAVAGRHDKATPIDTVREIGDGVANARLVVLDDVAHLAPAERPATAAVLIAGAGSAAPSPADQLRTQGMAVRRAVLGDAHVDRAIANVTDFTRDFQDFITRYAWGSIWTRPGLDRRSRSMITLTALVARGHHEELAMHIRAARTNGLSDDEIKEVLLQSAVYCGVPDANTAFGIAQQVLDELARQTAERHRGSDHS